MRQPFKGGGGKKGMRQVTSKHQRKIILRPAPAPEPNATTTSSKGKETHFEEDEEEEDEEDEDLERDRAGTYGYRESLLEKPKPLAGMAITVSGCQGQKENLLKIAHEYGAERHSGLQEDTTHLVTDRPEGAKYKIALEQRMRIMTPDWLEAVRNAWTSAEEIDFDELEDQYRLLPLDGVVFTLTHFAKGDYKSQFLQLMLEAGAEYSPRMDTNVTHLIVASPSAPHSQTPASDKLMHARRNRRHLRPGFEVVWEGWAREAIKFGGRREARDQAWIHQEGKGEPQEDLSWTVRESRPRSTPHPRASTSASHNERARPLSQSSRDLVGGGGNAVAARKFTGYDNSITETVQEQARRSAANHDLANGKILKKRRRVAGPDASQGNPEQLYDDFSQAAQAEPLFEIDRSVAGAQSPFDLPHPDDLGGGLPVPPEGYEDENMVLEMRDGEVGLQRTKKSKSAIKAITSKRTIAEVEAAPKAIPQLRSIQETGAQDDSGFLENTELSDKREQAVSSSNTSSQGSIPCDIFRGLTMAVMDIKARDPSVIAGYIEKGGGEAIIDASEEELERVDWIVVDFVEAPERFLDSSDSRVVSVCWIELCLWAEKVVPLEDRVLDRPIPYPCPVKGAENLRVHFSGFFEGDGPFMHHNRRFLHAVGVAVASGFSRECTHLILGELEENPSLTPSRIDSSENRKVQKAREWSKEIVSMRDFRKQIAELAHGGRTEDNRDNSVQTRAKGKGKGREYGKEITNEVDSREVGGRQEEDSLAAGPLHDCVVFFSTKSNFDRQALADTVKDLGGTASRQYSDSVTHFIYSDPSPTINKKSLGKASEAYKDLKLAKTSATGCHIVHPRWIEECGRLGARASELDFPHTFDSRKGGQIFGAGTASPPPHDFPETSVSRVSRSRRETTDATEKRRTPAKSTPRKKSQLDFETEVVTGAGSPKSRSPTPRRRRSDSARTELAEEDLPAQQEPAPAQSSSPATNRQTAPLTASSSQPFEPSNDHSTIPALSEIPPRQTDEANLERMKAETLRKKEELLKKQTDALRLAMQPDLGGAKLGKNGSRSRTNLFGKKQQSISNLSPQKKHLSPTRTTSLPTLLPSSSPTKDGRQPPASSNQQYSQSQSQLCTANEVRVLFDEPQAIEARKRIQERQREREEEEQRRKKEQEHDDAVESQGRRVTRSAKKGMY